MPTRRQCANAIRALAIDAIEKANSGHPGAPLGMADMAEALWRHGFKHNPADPKWVDRDRFVLSNGHASMLLYALLHLTGYDLTMEDIENFRQWGSKTPGHPEYGHTPGVDITTGPLGSGISSAVGMALAERMLAEKFNKPGHTIVDHHTYVFLGDGCMMEGVSHEACSLAGVWKLGKLIALYDCNGISIDGKTDGWFTEDVGARYKAYGWQVIGPIDGHDEKQLDQALAAARANTEKPSLIICKTHIGYGTCRADSAKVHGSPLGAEAAAEAKKTLGWTEPPFVIPQDIYDAWDARRAGAEAESKWQADFEAYAKDFPAEAAEFSRRMAGKLPEGFSDEAAKIIASFVADGKDLATRKCSNKVLESLVPVLPEMLGGSADLTGSVGTKTSVSVPLDPKTYEGNYISYGVREFGMSTIMNGMAVHGGFLPYAGTFMVFSDYLKHAVRLAALMKLRAVWVLTHDSYAVGEDGPTHEPVEQLPTLRALPGVRVWRPCDVAETAQAWVDAVKFSGPTCLSLSRQTLPFVSRTPEQAAGMARGGYVLRDCDGQPEVILIASGSEVSLCLGAYEKLSAQGRRVRVVSMPCTEIFDAQDAAYRESVLPSAVRARVAVEASQPDFWYKYAGLDGAVVGMDHFGASAPGKVLAEHFGFTVDNVVKAASGLLK